MARSSRSNDSPGAGAVTVVAGSIRTADDPTALDVKISIWDTEVTMRADGAEIGHWPSAAVAISPIDAFTFEFVAEGDRLVFTPNNPDEFKQHPMVSGSSKGKRKRRGKKPNSVPEPAQLRWDEDSQAELDLRKSRVKGKKEEEPRQSRKDRKAAARKAQEAAEARRVNQAPVVEYDAPRPQPSKPSRKDRKAAAREAKEATAALMANQAPVVDRDAPRQRQSRHDRRRQRQPEPVAQAPAIEALEAPAEPEPRKAQPKKVRTLRREPKPRVDSNGHSRIAELRHRAWIASLDFARQYDLFGLDRVPVNLEDRDNPNHAHTWTHRVAAASGPGSFICTLCGAFKKPGS